jgi:hypothetical protein
MVGGAHADFDLVSTGWMRILPEPAYQALTSLQALHRRPVVGDLDDLLAGGLLRIGGEDGLDAPFDPVGRLERADDDALWVRRWVRFGEFARERGLPMATPRDAIALLRDIGVVERIDRGGVVCWRSVAPVPLAEEVLPLSVHEQAREARVRWVLAFEDAEHLVAGWLAEQPGGSLTHTTLARIADRLSLDVEDARFGLAHAIGHHGTVACVPDPEVATPDAPLALAFARSPRRRRRRTRRPTAGPRSATAWRP